MDSSSRRMYYLVLGLTRVLAWFGTIIGFALKMSSRLVTHNELADIREGPLTVGEAVGIYFLIVLFKLNKMSHTSKVVLKADLKQFDPDASTLK